MSPRLAGNGLANRCAMWHQALAGMGSVTAVVAPVAGPVAPGSDEIVVVPSDERCSTIPRLAQGLTVERGRALAEQIGEAADGVDLVVAIRSYTALLGVGLREATGARLVVDLDDDDASFFRSIGDEDEAVRFEQLVDSLRHSADLAVST